jgi:hypothetical protein
MIILLYNLLIMARITDGVNGGFSGKAGSVIGVLMRGKSFMRGLPKKSTKKPSPAQLVSRAKFKILQEWRSRYQEIFAVTFLNHTQERSAQNAAHRNNTQIVVGEYPNFEIDRSEIMISQGNLPVVKDLKMEYHDHSHLHFTWDSATEKGGKRDDLVSIAVLYEDAFYLANFSIAERQDGECTFELKYSENHTAIDVYFTLLSNDRRSAANSVYMGKVIL